MPVTPKLLAGTSGFSSIRGTRPSSESTGTPRWRRCSGSLTGVKQDAGAVGVGPEGIHHGLYRSLHDVVGQHDEHGFAIDEPFGQAERLGDPAGPLLVGVGEAVDAELMAVAQQAAGTIAGMGPPVTSIISSIPALTRASIDQAIMGRS